MNLSELQCAHTTRIAQLVIYANAAGIKAKVQEWQRDLATQKIYILKGVSKTLDSRHIDLLATDMYIILNGVAIYCEEDSPEEHKEMYRLLGVYWESRGGRWGGRFHDAAQFKAKHGRDFDPAVDIGWDPYHFETAHEVPV